MNVVLCHCKCDRHPNLTCGHGTPGFEHRVLLPCADRRIRGWPMCSPCARWWRTVGRERIGLVYLTMTL